MAVAPALGVAADTEASANLDVTQPHYVDSDVGVDTSGDRPTYLTSGRVLYLTPENFNAANVTDYGIREREGELTYDADLGAYKLNTDGTNGTLHVYWVSETSRQVEVTENNTTTVETVTETTRYEAAIQTENTNLQHVQPGLIDRYRSDAANWSEWESTICEITGGADSCNIQQETQQAVNQMKIIHNPTALFTGGLTAALILLFTSPGGLLLVLVDKVREHFAGRAERSRLNQIESLDSDRATVEDELDILDREKRQRNAATQDIGELIEDPHLAAAVRGTYGDTVHDVHVGYNADTRDENVAHDRLQAMALAGYSATMDYDQDAGEWKLHVHAPVDDAFDDQPGVRLKDIHHEHLRGLLPWLAVDDTFRSFDLPNADIDREQLEMRTTLPATVDELADEYRDREFEFHSAEAYAECLADLFKDIEQKPLTETDGSTDTVRDRLSSLFRFESRLEDECPLPVTSFQKHRHQTMLELHDPAESARTRLRNSREGHNV